MTAHASNTPRAQASNTSRAHTSNTPRAQLTTRDGSPASERARDKSARNNLAGLAVSGLSVRFDETVAVDDVTFHVEPGEVLALLGPSGCGKSTLLRAITGLQTYAQGEVAWAGKAIDRVPVHQREFGLMFQDGQLFPHRNVARNVAYGLKGTGLSRSGIKHRVSELLELVGLPSFGERAIVNLSGGERQRVALARALAPAPRLLLLDEPLSALDRDLRERLAFDLRQVLTATGTTAIFVTHDHDEAFAIADRIAVMDAGKLLQIGSPQQIWRTPASEQVAKFLGYRWFWDSDAGRVALHPGSFTVAEPTAESEKPDPELSRFAGRVMGIAGAYREGHLVRVSTDELGVIEVRFPGSEAPAVDLRVQLAAQADAIGWVGAKNLGRS